MEIPDSHKEFASAIMLLKERAMRIGLYRTGQLLEIPIIEVGWEMQKEPTPETQRARQREVASSFKT